MKKAESKEIQEAYATIAQFFCAWSLYDAERLLAKLMEAALSQEATRAKTAKALFFFKSLHSLVQAAMLLHQVGSKRTEAILAKSAESPDLSRCADYFGWQQPAQAWWFVPRALSAKEYHDPYRVFQKLAAYASEEEWTNILDELQEFAFYEASLMRHGTGLNVIRIYRLLQKLIEAAHLIWVRAIREVNEKTCCKPRVTMQSAMREI